MNLSTYHWKICRLFNFLVRFDQRLIVDGTVNHLRNLGIAVHARSLYLQVC